MFLVPIVSGEWAPLSDSSYKRGGTTSQMANVKGSKSKGSKSTQPSSSLRQDWPGGAGNGLGTLYAFVKVTWL